jgi:hypothetical protein
MEDEGTDRNGNPCDRGRRKIGGAVELGYYCRCRGLVRQCCSDLHDCTIFGRQAEQYFFQYGTAYSDYRGRKGRLQGRTVDGRPSSGPNRHGLWTNTTNRTPKPPLPTKHCSQLRWFPCFTEMRGSEYDSFDFGIVLRKVSQITLCWVFYWTVDT